MVVSEPAAELMLPELPPDKDFTKSIAALARLSVTPKVENIESAAVQQILDSIEKHRETGGLRVARLQNELARIREQQSDLAAAERLLRECLETMRRAELGQTVEAVSFMNNLAGVLYRNDQAASAENTYLQALRLLNNDDPTYKARATPLLWNLGTLYDETGQFEQARAFLTSATELALDNWGAEDPRTQRCLKKLSKSQFSKVCEPSL